MGIHSDTKEDNEERLDQFGFRRYESEPKNTSVPLPIFECSLCGLECISSQSLSDHVQKVHAGQHVYVRANNIVISDHHYFDEPLKTLECVSIGVDDVVADVLAESVQETVVVEGEKDLVYDRKGKCYANKRCSNDNCMGETWVSVDVVRKHVLPSGPEN